MNLASIVRLHFEELRGKFKGLDLTQRNDGSWVVTGHLGFSAHYKDKQLDDEYEIEILIPIGYPGVLPTARETGNRIPMDFHHSGDNLCLGEPGEVIQKFQEEPTLVGFTERCLIPYLYNFGWMTRYGYLPFGELSHGWLGILEHYQEVFQINDRKVVLNLLQLCKENNYRGHDKCPCGSKRRLRRCHGGIIKTLIAQIPRELLAREYEILLDCILGLRKTNDYSYPSKSI